MEVEQHARRMGSEGDVRGEPREGDDKKGGFERRARKQERNARGGLAK